MSARFHAGQRVRLAMAWAAPPYGDPCFGYGNTARVLQYIDEDRVIVSFDVPPTWCKYGPTKTIWKVPARFLEEEA